MALTDGLLNIKKTATTTTNNPCGKYKYSANSVLIFYLIDFLENVCFDFRLLKLFNWF
jgi:hypothetical protein